MRLVQCSPVRIVVAGINFAPELTGIGRYTGEMATWLASRGHEVVAISAPPHYPEWSVSRSYAGKGFWREDLGGVTVLRTPVLLPRRGTISTLRRVALETSYSVGAARWWLPRLVAAQRPDVAIAVCPPLQDAVWPSILGAIRRVPWLLHVQDLQVDAAIRLGMIRNATVSSALLAAEERMLMSAPWVSTISGAMLKQIRAKGVHADRSFLFPNWTDLAHVTPRPADPNMRARLGAAADQVLVVYSGNLGKKQGLETVIEIADRLRGRPNLRFAIVGNGVERVALERSAADRAISNVTFHDLVADHELPDLLAAGDIHLIVQKGVAADLVMPSKVTNIFAAGRPSIVTAAPGTELHEVITGSGAGIAVAPDDVEQFLNAVLHLAGAAHARRTMGDDARRYASVHLGKERVLTAFEARLLAIARQPRGTN